MAFAQREESSNVYPLHAKGGPEGLGVTAAEEKPGQHNRQVSISVGPKVMSLIVAGSALAAVIAFTATVPKIWSGFGAPLMASIQRGEHLRSQDELRAQALAASNARAMDRQKNLEVIQIAKAATDNQLRLDQEHAKEAADQASASQAITGDDDQGQPTRRNTPPSDMNGLY